MHDCWSQSVKYVYFTRPVSNPAGCFFLTVSLFLKLETIILNAHATRLSVAMFVSIGNCSAIIAGFLAKACRRTDQWIHALMILHRLMAWKLRPAHRPVWWPCGAGMANMFATCCNTMKSKQFQYKLLALRLGGVSMCLHDMSMTNHEMERNVQPNWLWGDPNISKLQLHEANII